MSLPPLNIVVVNSPESPASYMAKYILIRIIFTFLFGVVMLMAAPTWTYGLVMLSHDAELWLGKLWDVTHLYDRIPLNVMFFNQPFTTLMLLFNLIPWAVFIPIVESVAHRYVQTPARNMLANTELGFLKAFGYTLWVLLLISLCMIALGMTQIFDRLESITMFETFFLTLSRGMQLGIFLVYVTIILFNAYHDAKFIPPDMDSPISSLGDTIKEIAARKWEEVAEDDEFQTISREEIIYHTPNELSNDPSPEDKATPTTGGIPQ